jgi:hypothetical protein
MLFVSINEVIGVNVLIQDYPKEIGNNEFEVGVLIEGANSGTNYLRADLFQEGTTKYFGETFNTSAWYGGSSGIEYFPIEILKDSSVSATLKARVGEPSYSKYPAPGDYLLRIRRYTASGNVASDTQEPVKLRINVPVDTPTPEVSSASNREESTNTPKPTPIPTPKPTKRPTPKPVLTNTPEPTPVEEKVLALDDERENEEDETPAVQDEDNKVSKKNLPLASVFLLIVGAVMLSYGGFFIFRELRIKYRKNEEKEK